MIDRRLAEFTEILSSEIRHDSSGIVEFEAAQGLTPNFSTYYGNWRKDDRRLARTAGASLIRRQHIPAFVDSLVDRFGANPLVLDVGCGYGSDSILLARLGCRVVGIDPDPDLISISNHRAEYWNNLGEWRGVKPSFVHARVEDYQTPNKFDGVFAAECLHHCEPVEISLLGIRSLIRDDGRVLVLESNGANPANEILLGRRQRRILMAEGDRFVLYGNECIRSVRRWRRLFDECGFELESHHYSRHLVSEALGTQVFDSALTRLPGRSLMSIHISMQLSPRSALGNSRFLAPTSV